MSKTKGFIFLFFTGFCVLSASLQAACIHAIIIGDTQDAGDITRAAIQYDMGYMQTLVSKVGEYTGMETHVVLLTEEKFNPTDLLDQVEQLKAAPDDTILFYYNSHGFRTLTKASPWPNFFFPNEYAGVEYDNIVELLGRKNPRFLLVIADTCNSYLDVPPMHAPKMMKRLAMVPSLDKIKQNYKRLFLDYRGVVLISSAEQGHYAYAEPDGAVFSKAFLKELTKETERAWSADWSEIIVKTAAAIADHQQPIYAIQDASASASASFSSSSPSSSLMAGE